MLQATNRPFLAYFDAIKNLRLRQVKLILKTGYDPNLLLNGRGQNGLQFLVSYFGATEAHFRLQLPLNKAAYLSIAKLLLDSGLDPNTPDLLSGDTIIFDAIRYNDKDLVAMLFNYVDFSVRNKQGETALMCAARFAGKQLMRIMLEHLRHLDMDSYFLRQRNRLGLTALEIARVDNLEAAKVLTKHLIAYGHPVGAALARSSSQHQLLHGRPLASHLRAPSFNQRAAPQTLLDDSGLSDYDSDLLAAHYRPLQAGAAHRSRHSLFYDHQKAAQFNQYLLEQRDFGGHLETAQQLTGSDEDDFGPSTGAQSGLYRSRSCMLSQPKKMEQSGKSSSCKKRQEDAANASWESSQSVANRQQL